MGIWMEKNKDTYLSSWWDLIYVQGIDVMGVGVLTHPSFIYHHCDTSLKLDEVLCVPLAYKKWNWSFN